MAIAHARPFLSRHIGSKPGDGPSGMQVNPLVPCLSVFIAPFSSIAMMVASFPTSAGAADNALLIMSSSVVGGATGPVFMGMAGAVVVAAAGGAAVCAAGGGGAVHAPIVA